MITREQNKFRFRIGVVLFVISNVAFVLLLFIPTWELEIELKTKVAFALAIVGEVLFWASSYLLGKEILQKYKKYLNPANWFKRDKTDSDDNS